MTAEAGSGGATAPTHTAEPTPPSVINQKKADEITLTKQRVMIVRADPIMKAKMATRGYDDPELSHGLGLVQEAEGALQDRQAALAPAAKKKEARDAFEAEVRAEFMDYRKTIRTEFNSPAVRKGLGATGDVTDDLQKFKQQVESAYQAAFAPPFAAVLEKRGWPAARLHAAKAKPEQLIALDNAFQVAEGDKERNTELFDAAFDAMQAWSRGFCSHARIAFRGDRATLEALKLKK